MSSSLYRRVLQDRQDLFNEALAKGVYTPFLLPWDTLPVLFLIVGVVITPFAPKILARLCRLILTLLSFGYLVLRWPYARTVGLTAGYGIGLMGFWGMIMTVVLLVLHDPGQDFRRIELRKVKKEAANGSSHVSIPSEATQNGTLRKRTVPEGSNHHEERNSPIDPHEAIQGSKLVWQDRPQEFWHLIDWSADLMTTFRGINWNFRIPIKTYKVLPPEGDPPTLSLEGQRNNKTALKQLQRSSVACFIFYYLLLDFLKTFMMTDPYWLGIAPLESPTTWPWLARINEVIPIATRFVRMSASLASVVAALTFIFSLNPLFFCTVLPYVFGEKLYSVTKIPLLEVWMYPPQWGEMFTTLCNRGLAGMWSTWWHQMFRYGISEPSRLLTKSLNVNPRSLIGRVIQLLVAFGLTAGIHAAASSTTFSVIPSKPLHPFIFFFSQSIGIMVQTELSRQLNRVMKFPKWVQQAGNFMYVFLFLWISGPILADDFARCQIWLFEPVPVSIFRGLGLGPGDTWFPWIQFPEGGRWLGLWRGEHWYTSGIGIY